MMIATPTLGTILKTAFKITPSTLAMGPRIAPEYCVSIIPDKLFSSLFVKEPDHIRPLKKDYISVFAIKPANHP